MQIVFSCDNCGREFRKDASLSGKKGRCKDCGHIFLIPPLARKQSRQAATAVIDDPFGLDDVPVAVKRAVTVAEVPEEEIPLPRQVKPGEYSRAKRKSSRRKGDGGFFDGLPGFVYLAIVLLSGSTFLLAATQAIGPPHGGLIFLGATVLSSLVLFFYGFIGIMAVAFRGGAINGFLCWVCPPYLIGYAYKEWDAMKGVVLSYFASMGMIAFMGVVMPSLPGVNPGLHRERVNPHADAPDPAPVEAMPSGFPVRGFRPPAPGAPPGVQPPMMTNSLTIVVSGGADSSFGDHLTELIKTISPAGYSLSSTGSGGRSSYSVSLQKSISAQEFADQITWARVSRVSGQTIEIDGPVSRTR